jgi:hypothetical protein
MAGQLYAEKGGVALGIMNIVILESVSALPGETDRPFWR